MPDGPSPDFCELCGRSGVSTTVHHLTPKSEGGAYLQTAALCPPCHKQIHALYNNKDLVAMELTTIAALREDPAMAKYIAWIRKQPPERLPPTRKSRHVRGRR